MVCKDYEGLLMAFLDKELNPTETAEVNEHLLRCEGCREDYDELTKTAATLDAISFAEPGDDVLEELWKSPFARAERISGLVLIIGGYAALILYVLYELLTSNEGPALPRIATAAIVLGFTVLLISVARERLRSYRNDPYREVER